MKKFIFASAAAVSSLLMVSCSSEDMPNAQGDESVVAVSVKLPDGLQTRAYGDGFKATRLTYAVYEHGKQQPLAVCTDGANQTATVGHATMIDLETTLSLRLTTGKSYDFVFWADTPDSEVYTFDAAGQTITANYETDANVEELDAFFTAKTDYKVAGDATISAQLRRPFAQVNILTDDLEANKNAGFDTQMSSLRVQDVPNTLNLLTGVTTGEGEVSFAAAGLPTGTVTINDKAYEYVGMNYIMVPAAKTTRDMVFTVYSATNESQSFNFNSVPTQRNYRTNIYGSLLTNGIDVKVEILPGFEGEYNGYPFPSTVNGEEFNTFAEVVDAVNAAATDIVNIELGGDAEWATGNAGDGASTIFTNAGATVNIDLKGHTMVMTGQGGFKSAAKVNFKNGTIVDKTAYGYENGETAWEFTYLEFEGGEMTFDNIVFNNTVMFSSERATVKNSTFRGIATLSSNQANEYAAWVETATDFENCTFEGCSRGIKICHFYNTVERADVVNIKNCQFKDIPMKPGVSIDAITGTPGVKSFSKVVIEGCTFTNVYPSATTENDHIYTTDDLVPELIGNTVN